MLQKIIDQVNPDDLVNFSVCCKKVYGAAERCLVKHRERIETYSELRYYDSFTHQVDDRSASLLREICHDDYIAFYPRSLKITRCEFPDDYGASPFLQSNELLSKHLDDGTIGVREMSEEIESVIDEKLSELLYYNDKNVDAWRRRLTQGTGRPILFLLLLLLPNLESVQLTGGSFKDRILGHILDWIAKGSQDADPTFKSVALTKLSKVEIKYGQSQILAAFAALPSLRILTAGSVLADAADAPYGVDLDWPYGQHVSGVTALNLQSSCLSAASFSRLLGGIKGLKHFTYDGYGTTCCHYGDVPVFSIVRILLEHAKSSLESVEFTGLRDGACLNGHCHGSFKDFKVLKHIRMHFGHRMHQGHYLEDNKDYNSFNHVGCLRDGYDDIEHLVDLLPASVRSVEIDGEFDTLNLSWLVKGLLQRKAKSVSHLESIKFMGSRAGADRTGAYRYIPIRAPADALREKCRIMGVKLIL